VTARFLVDEDLPRSLARRLVAAGCDALDVRDVGLRGRPDHEIAAWAKAADRMLLSGDLGFANILAYPLGSHPGIVVVRFPNTTPVDERCSGISTALEGLTDTEITGALIIIEPGRVRLRRPR
jgi:predicted nuclease of predicted toxin-antitoxin system